ncbi:hypothetical protein PHYSODRAFT_257164 [Phytophthora sojae]|uniref:Transposase n=1 Tax=Phytophthora sojae (strain P6497) TaxID=1094619 RepID=G4YK15_PHYSP|nr:hypothetical protein PHYSODRAFT_257164 [Phytophthora sojae]EGZ27520.1 hypothetical protein PHYSODRAFT_257164 [Phytophthora sojae]|eukprot:XP_009514795.1 hypothetical protein PHYSODRAFT_257164 [Phytophthora sojae]
MPRDRIPTHYTNRLKARAVEDWRAARASGTSHRAFAESSGFPRPSLQNWGPKYPRLAQESQRQPRASPSLPPVPSRASRLTLSGSGRKPDTAPIEDTLCVFIKDEQRLEHTVTVDFIIDMTTELMPEAKARTSRSPGASASCAGTTSPFDGSATQAARLEKSWKLCGCHLSRK